MDKKFARITLDKDFPISRVDKRIYGSFVEHFGPGRLRRRVPARASFC